LYDFIFDAVGKAPKAKCKKNLKSGGIFLSVMGSVKVEKNDLNFIKQLIEKEKIIPIIDKCFSFDQIPEAHAYVDKGHKKGNVVINIVDKVSDI
jgi:NADPH:quinone reductase-like Zn-dependent oxidoreductase